MAGNADLVDHYARIHGTRVYGTSSVKYIRHLRPEIAILRPASILDYGCGQSIFLDCLELGGEVELLRYDPAIPAYAQLPANKADLLVSIDVLEHIEEGDLDKVMAEMRASARDALIVIDTRPAKHRLADGRNAHVSLHPHEWWRERLSRHFDHLEPVRTARRSRAAFRTWSRPGADTLRYVALRTGESARYYAKRLLGRHKRHWKVSSTGRPKD